MKEKLKLFSGTSNEPLARNVAGILHLPLGKSEIIQFDNSEVRVRVTEPVKDSVAVVIQTTSNPTNSSLMELFFFCDALKRGEAKRIVGVIPYFGYARQNIQHREGEAVSAHVIVRFLEAVGYDEIYVFDLHDEATGGIFSVPFKNLTALPLLASEVKKHLGKINRRDIAVVSADQGGVERGRIFGSAFFGTEDFPLVVAEKKRDLNTKHRSTALDLHGEVEGKTVIIVDDIVTSGGTLLDAVALCEKAGAKNIIAAIVHSDFSVKAPGRLQESPISAFFTTDTIRLARRQRFPKLREVSVAPLIAQEFQESIQ